MAVFVVLEKMHHWLHFVTISCPVETIYVEGDNRGFKIWGIFCSLFYAFWVRNLKTLKMHHWFPFYFLVLATTNLGGDKRIEVWSIFWEMFHPLWIMWCLKCLSGCWWIIKSEVRNFVVHKSRQLAKFSILWYFTLLTDFLSVKAASAAKSNP